MIIKNIYIKFINEKQSQAGGVECLLLRGLIKNDRKTEIFNETNGLPFIECSGEKGIHIILGDIGQKIYCY
jgi:hypothetical protein